MAAYSVSNYKFTWRGATVLREINSNVDRAMVRLQREVLAYLKTNLHEYTGQMRREAFAEVRAETGGKRTLVAGSDAPHTLFHEFRYHPQLRETLDTFAPKVTQYLQDAFRE